MDESPTPRPEPAPARRNVARFRWTSLAVGLVCGMVSVSLGVSGGLLMVPLAALLLRLNRGEATGTSLAAILFIALAGAVAYHAHGGMHHEPTWGLRAVFLVALGEVIGALAGSRLAPPLRTGWPRRLVGAAVAVAGMWLITRMPLAGAPVPAEDAIPLILLLGAGLLAGVFSGIAGVGGDLFVPLLLVALLGLPQRLAQGLSLAVVLPASALGVLLHLRRGNVVTGLLGWLAAGGVLGVALAAQGLFALSPNLLRAAFGALLIGVGVHIVQRSWERKTAE